MFCCTQRSSYCICGIFSKCCLRQTTPAVDLCFYYFLDRLSCVKESFSSFPLCVLPSNVMFKCVLALQIREEIKHFGINIYQFPECDSDEDEDFKNQDQILKVLPLSQTLIWF